MLLEGRQALVAPVAVGAGQQLGEGIWSSRWQVCTPGCGGRRGGGGKKAGQKVNKSMAVHGLIARDGMRGIAAICCPEREGRRFQPAAGGTGTRAHPGQTRRTRSAPCEETNYGHRSSRRPRWLENQEILLPIDRWVICIPAPARYTTHAIDRILPTNAFPIIYQGIGEQWVDHFVFCCIQTCLKLPKIPTRTAAFLPFKFNSSVHPPNNTNLLTKKSQYTEITAPIFAHEIPCHCSCSSIFKVNTQACSAFIIATAARGQDTG